jgi:hypothetical protein
MKFESAVNSGIYAVLIVYNAFLMAFLFRHQCCVLAR